MAFAHAINIQNVHHAATQKDQKIVFKTNYCLMQVKSIAEEHSAILLTFIKLPFVKTFLYLLEWPLTAGFTCSHLFQFTQWLKNADFGYCKVRRKASDKV